VNHPSNDRNWAGRLNLPVFLLLVLLGGLFPSQLHGFSFTELYRFPLAYPGPAGLTLGGDGALYGTCQGTGEYNHGFVFRLGDDGAVISLASFARTNGAKPLGRMVSGPDGALYGTTQSGGLYGFGTIFRVTTNGELSTLIAFTGTNAPYYGSQPSGLGLGQDGALYGCTRYGLSGCYRVTIAGEFTSLATFTSEHGALANGALTEGPDGAFYGTMSSGGAAGYGTIFRVTTNGNLAVVVSLVGTNGGQPMGSLLRGADGALYGTTYFGGENSSGTIFRCTPDGNLTILHSFDTAANGNGYYPQAGLVQDEAGFLYGAAQLSGAYGSQGTIFRATTNGAVTTLVTFWVTNGASPLYDLILGGDGALYGTTMGGGEALAGMAFRLTTNGAFTALASFRPTGGETLESGLTQMNDGRLWGTTSFGGTNGVGTVFCLSTNGELNLSVSLNASVGAGPLSTLSPGPDGFLYGAANKGGAHGFGSIYRVSTSGVVTPVAFFNNANGANPYGPLVWDEAGNVYGTATSGGGGYGTIFRVGTNGSVSVLAAFDLNTKGAFPRAGLMRAKDGAFYGTTASGGASSAGTVFRVTTNGVLTALASFNTSTLGSSSRSTLVQHPDGNLYGTVFQAPATQYGTFFRVRTNGSVEVMATSGIYRPQYPSGPMIVGADGALYGTSLGGIYGSVFRLTTNGAIATLVWLESVSAGVNPMAGLIPGQDGKFYGTASAGQDCGGTVFCVDIASRFTGLTPQGNSRFLAFSGLPSVAYQFERAANPTGPWVDLAVVTPNTMGAATYTNVSAPATNAFYRAKIR
jgi:uncharacterized repeat protein (TIGR03803 family)